jgi:hypothetical protein
LPLVACPGGSTRAARGVRRSNAGAIQLFLRGVVEDCGDALGLDPVLPSTSSVSSALTQTEDAGI